ncbi:hypothetical protein RvY_01776 [Ramazzottius varieornatus]|uniref:Uncharacterized protein n=1 Tax=Ramazzottius varieornatus TaxID=947166 RepID=A0A1D1UPK9_RAMVA|nr:hypothetical protein RvY_01776 [Ramazzottius varieornatus]
MSALMLQRNARRTDRGSPGRKRPRPRECNPDQLSPARVDQELSEEGEEEEGNDAVNTTIDSSVGQLDMDRTIEGIKNIPELVSMVSDDPNDGWTLNQVCSMLLYVAKSTGTSNAALGKFLKVMAVVIDGKRSLTDPKKRRKFPQSARSLKSLLNIKRNHCEKIVYICPYQRQVRKKTNETWETELCGYVLREVGEGKHCLYHCDLCGTNWERKIVEKDGNHFVINPIRNIAGEALHKYGKLVDPRQEHSKFAASGQTLCVAPRGCVGGEDLPKDLECFLMNLTLQLQELDENSNTFLSIHWIDAFGEEHYSPGYVHGFLSDSPERTAINGHLSHSACQGCIYCLQVGESIAHKISYKYVKNPTLKCHQDFVDMTAQWDTLSTECRKYLLDERRRIPKTFIGYRLAEDGCCERLFHRRHVQGLSRWFLRQIVEGGEVLNLTKSEIKQIDTLWLTIAVPGHESRKTRSIAQYKNMKAHELRFFIQHGAPYVTKDIVPEDFHTILCLASRIAWLSTQDSISEKDISIVDRLSNMFLGKFERIHGPLQNVFCYGPENEIGVIGQRIRALNNTTKSIINDFRILAECAVMVEELVSNESVPQPVTHTARSIMGMTESIFYARVPSGICRLIGNAEKIPSKRISQAVMAYADHHGFIWVDDKIHLFKRAVVEAGISVRTRKHNEASCRNGSIVFERTGKVIAVKHIVAILSVDTGSVLQTLVFEELATRTEEPEVSFPTTDHITPVLPPVPHPEASSSYAQSASPSTYGRSPEPVEPSPTDLTGHQPSNLRLGALDVPSHSFPTPQNVTAFGPVLLDVGQEYNSTPLIMQASTDTTPLIPLSAVPNAESKSHRRTNTAVRLQLASFLRNAVVVDKAGTLSLDEVNRRLRSEFPEALVNSQDRRTLARFLAEIMKKAFPECKKGRVRTGPSVDRKQPIFYENLRFVAPP